MKNIKAKKLNIDPIAEAKKGPYFERFSKEAKERIKLGVEIYNKRELMGISQQELAKRAETTQKVISNIENGDVNVGFSLLNRIATVLNFNCDNWSNILNFNGLVKFLFVGGKTISSTAKMQKNALSRETYNLSIK